MSPSVRSRGALLARIAAVLLLLVLWGVAASDRAPLALTAAAHAAPTDVEADSGEAAEAPSRHDLSALRIFNRVVLLIKENYVDPKRIDARKMLINALDGVERQVAEVLVDGDEKSPTVRITVNKVSQEFDVTKVDTFWRMSFALKEMFDFIGRNLSSKDETREIEYAAVNGMLSTLDPHSILLKPEYFKEMKLQTKGEFGGLGFVIQMREGNLTVVKVLKGTPAQKAGIKSKDIITRIGKESTVNMDLQEAVGKLRGKPGSQVSIHLLRPDSPSAKPKPMTLTRAIINVESVASKLLDGNIGYIKLKGFQGNTSRDLRQELKRLHQAAAPKGGLKGLVLDLRGNPGGLLDQAIQVSDLFIREGTLVTTVGYSDKLREVKKARGDDGDTDLPLVAIVNPGSASASEIVAGALKNLNRAMVIGRPTFGKGSVQVLYDFPDESALKLTIAQYLTPGDISIQEVGITPDVELIPARVSKDKVDVFAPKKLMGEADLEKHFGNPDSETVASKREEVVQREKPLETLRFLRDEPRSTKDWMGRERPDRDDFEIEDLEGTDPDTDEIVEDYQIRFARDLLAAAPYSRRDQQLKAAKPFLEERKRLEAERIQQAIAALGIDWSLPDTQGGTPAVAVQMSPGPQQAVRAGDTLTWTVTVQNTGTATLKRLRAHTECENPYLDRREFLFGTLAPGQKRSWTVTVKLPKDLISRRDDITFKFAHEGAGALDDWKSELNVVELPRPAFAFDWQVVDRCAACNGDGMVQPGETVEVVVEVKNVGAGKAWEAVAVLKNKADERVSLTKGRVKLGEIPPGETRSGTFEFEVSPEARGEPLALQLSIGDEPVDEYVTDKLPVPLFEEGAPPAKVAARAARAQEELVVREAASDSARVIGKAPKGATMPVEGKVGGYYRVTLAGRPGFVPEGGVRLLANARARPLALSVEPQRTEPRIVLSGVGTEEGGLVTTAERFAIAGEAVGSRGLRDLYVFVNDQKVFFKSAADDEEANGSLKFRADLPLKEGNNTVLIVAREDKDFIGRRVLLINRRGAELAQQAPPSAPAAAQRAVPPPAN